MAPLLSVAIPKADRAVGIVVRVVQVGDTGDALPGAGVRQMVPAAMPRNAPATLARTRQ